jgi:putative MATE family efflux protein
MPNPLLSGPILATLVRLALPNVMAMSATVLVGIAEISYIGILGTEPLAAMALVFPFAMLTQMMSAGAMGGGVSSAVSRALGAGDVDRARALAAHALVIGTIAGVLYSLFFLLFGPALYALLGGSGRVLTLAVGYSNVLFSGALLIWLSNSLASVLRGAGNMRLPSLTILGTSALQIILGGSLGLGLGPMPRLGMPGVALGQLIATAAGVAILLWYLRSEKARVRLTFRGIAFRSEMFFDILKVGALACLSPVQSILTILIFTGVVARFGVPALAGYGIGARLEFLLIPIAFGVGVAAVPMVGMAIGASEIARARAVARTAGGLSALVLGVIGALVAFLPDLWAGWFSRDAAVLFAARQYLQFAGPGFAFFGLGLTLYFAAQGSGNVLGPVLASTLRLLIVAAGGAWIASSGAPAAAVFTLVGASMTIYGLATATSIFLTTWGPAARLRVAT